MAGRVVGNYQMQEKLGAGGLGDVFRAVDSTTGCDVALRLLKPEIAARPGVLRRFRAEALTLARLEHPAVARLYMSFKDGDDYFIAMEHVPGESLAATLQRNGPIPWPQALGYTVRILAGLQYVHTRGVLHRDVRPGNVMLTPMGEIKLVDVGIGHVLAGGRTTSDYTAPEQLQDKAADARSEIYAVGVMLHEMIYGRLPGPGPLGVTVPPQVAAALTFALEPEPNDRYQSAAAFSETLRVLLPTVASTVTPPATAGLGRRRWLGAAAVIALMALLAVMLVMYRRAGLARP